MDISPEEYDRYTVQRGDLLVCEGGQVGRCAIWSVKLPICGFQKALHRLRPRNAEQDVARLMYYALRAAAKGHAFTDGHVSTIAHLTGDKLRLHRFPFPPLSEQTTIVHYLGKAIVDIDTSISHARNQIELVQEYRTRLIADVVTGKVDVREAGAGLPEVDPLDAEDDPDDGSSREAESEGTGWRHGVEEGGSLADVSDAERSEDAAEELMTEGR